MQTNPKPINPKWFIIGLPAFFIIIFATTLSLFFIFDPLSSDSPAIEDNRASTPDEVMADIFTGMNSNDVYKTINWKYAAEACWTVSCSSITYNLSSIVDYTPTNTVGSRYWMWIFMPLEGNGQATVVSFEYYFSTDDDTVIAVDYMNYSEATDLIGRYGHNTIW